jgi:hypothetical protein
MTVLDHLIPNLVERLEPWRQVLRDGFGEVIQSLHAIHEAILDQGGGPQTRRLERFVAVNLDGTGAGQQDFRVPAGWEYQVKYLVWESSTGTPAFVLFRDAARFGNALAFSPALGATPGAVGATLGVDFKLAPGTSLVVVVTGGGASAQAGVTLFGQMEQVPEQEG